MCHEHRDKVCGTVLEQRKGTDLFNAEMFLQPDPIGYSDGMNLYAYVGNDPLNFTDPTGQFKGDLRGEYYDLVSDELSEDDLRAEMEQMMGNFFPGGTVTPRIAFAFRSFARQLFDKAKARVSRFINPVTKGAADAAKRLGVNLNDIPINNGIARTKINVSSNLNSKDINQLKDVLRSRGANRAEVDTGLIANEKLDAFLRRRVQDGKSFNGGTVRFSNSKNSDFTIDFNL